MLHDFLISQKSMMKQKLDCIIHLSTTRTHTHTTEEGTKLRVDWRLNDCKPKKIFNHNEH